MKYLYIDHVLGGLGQGVGTTAIRLSRHIVSRLGKLKLDGLALTAFKTEDIWKDKDFTPNNLYVSDDYKYITKEKKDEEYSKLMLMNLKQQRDQFSKRRRLFGRD